ncbi:MULTISPECIES: LysR family transcriptional regulator [unclassified Paenibacillus]|uniref:LysR family transcriptional regulator n=1 Tax=unclassified Paenibacillus TaxID=185978 RepID=UPI000CFCFF33|nr:MULTISPECIES: LysR family transcriptional regulator [unclassified Paenibacillus]PRA07638.1 LysR family transcriptional regulator [Paenibacillus sp. MYb63]PRA51283.1 LysR family transcriptional regulator [Paenibacillus sp. MYb67]QZN74404.1 LysR family transcriptional regulator [Paenibacillus sp. DR312]
MIDALEGRFFQAFIALLEEKSFSRAADRLGYVQSTVTTHIQQLERIIGQKLFHRYPRGVELTEAGHAFSKYAYQYVHLVECLSERMKELDQPSGTIRIRTQESFFLTRMLPFVQEYTKNAPAVNLRIEQGTYQDILKGVLDYELDFGIVPQNPNRQDILFYPLLDETIVFAASEDIARKVRDSGGQILQDQQFISNGTSCLYHTSAVDVLKNIGIRVKDALELPSLEMIKQYVSCGKGFALIPEIAIQNELKKGTLQILPFDSKMSFIHGLIVHKNRELNFTAKQFQSELLSSFVSD